MRRRGWLGGVFAAALAAALPGCKGEGGASSQAGKRPITATVRISPVVDDHPWVIAFLTQISISRPEGLDARLEGRIGYGGLRHPEPVIEGPSREALAAALARYEAEHARPPELAPIYERLLGRPEGGRWRLYFIDGSKGFTLDGDARAAIQKHEFGEAVHIYLSEAQAADLTTFTTEQVGMRIALDANGEALAIPVVREPIPGGELQLIPDEDSGESAEAVLRQLSEGM